MRLTRRWDPGSVLGVSVDRAKAVFRRNTACQTIALKESRHFISTENLWNADHFRAVRIFDLDVKRRIVPVLVADHESHPPRAPHRSPHITSGLTDFEHHRVGRTTGLEV